MPLENNRSWLRRGALILLLLAGSAVGYAYALRTVDFLVQRSLKKELADDMKAFYAGVQTGRATATGSRQHVGVEVSSDGWRIFADTGSMPWYRDSRDKLLSAGEWQSGLKFGSNLPGHRFFFTQDGLCYVYELTACLEEDQAHPEKGVHAFAFTSDARRIYTLTFGKDGTPLLARDDF